MIPMPQDPIKGRSLKNAYQKMTLYEKNVIIEDQMIHSSFIV
jgi:hypothetical protein